VSDPRETEQRLRGWLDANQPQRERLCIHLLPLFGRYSEIQPRRPKGGPDGACDIQAIYNDSIEVWGAVGFKNSANDSAEDKKWAVGKFNADIESALNQNPTLKGFVFFTNIDLTPTEQQTLKNAATNKGIIHVDIFYRERIRQMLDSTEGLGYRLQYLNIAMSQEEQISFINSLEIMREKQLQELSRKQEEVNHKLHRVEFLNECLRPVHTVMAFAVLNKSYKPEELGHFRLVIEIEKIYDPSPWPTLFIGGKNHYFDSKNNDTQVKLFGLKSLIWSEQPHELHLNRIKSQEHTQTRVLQFSGPLYHKRPFTTVGEFDRTHFDIFVTPQLLDAIQCVGFVVNNYALLELPRKKLVIAEQIGLSENNSVEWPDKLTDEEEKVGWKRLYIRSIDTENRSLPQHLRHASREIHFNKFTPNKMDAPAEEGGSLFESAIMMIRK
jgi:hypothetical protein